MFFESDTVIQKIKPSHKGPGYIGPNQIPFNDLSFNADVSATSYYHLISKATRFSNGDIDHKVSPLLMQLIITMELYGSPEALNYLNH
jgi:hypothetical protein